jgi:hypothetical protein
MSKRNIEANETDAQDAADEEAATFVTANDTEPVVYCGPNVPKGNLLSMAVFKGGLPGNVSRLIVKIPEIGGLIVPVSKLAETRKKIETQGTEENRLNQMVLSLREGI